MSKRLNVIVPFVHVEQDVFTVTPIPPIPSAETLIIIPLELLVRLPLLYPDILDMAIFLNNVKCCLSAIISDIFLNKR